MAELSMRRLLAELRDQRRGPQVKKPEPKQAGVFLPRIVSVDNEDSPPPPRAAAPGAPAKGPDGTMVKKKKGGDTGADSPAVALPRIIKLSAGGQALNMGAIELPALVDREMLGLSEN